jgi:hypothetical protein
VLDSGKLVFLEENQAVVLWGTDAGEEPSDDPASYQVTNADPLIWDQVHEQTSIFLVVLLHWEAAFGGAMPSANTASVNANLADVLNQSWSFVGEVNGMQAYNQPGRALCYLKWEDDWRIFVGSSTLADLNTVATELGVVWEEPD